MGQDLPGAGGPEVVALNDGLGETDRSLIGHFRSFDRWIALP
jgi:hypothetical protein